MNILKFLTHLGSIASALAQCLVQVHARPLSQGHPASRGAISAAPLLSECGEGVGQGGGGVPGTQDGCWSPLGSSAVCQGGTGLARQWGSAGGG